MNFLLEIISIQNFRYSCIHKTSLIPTNSSNDGFHDNDNFKNDNENHKNASD